MISKQAQDFWILLKSYPKQIEMPLAQAREADLHAEDFTSEPKGVAFSPASEVGGLWAEPPDAAPGRSILYFFGGGFAVGTPATRRKTAGHLALAADARVLVPNYRLAPEHPFPAALDDAVRAYQFLLDYAQPSKTVVRFGSEANFTLLNWSGSTSPVRARHFLVIVTILFTCTAGSGYEIHVRAGKSQAARDLQNRGLVEARKGNLDAAVRNYSAAIKLDPTMWPAYFNRAQVYLRQHKYELVIQDTNMALLEKSTFAQSELLRGEAYYWLGRYGDALFDFDKVISLQSNDAGHAVSLNWAAWIRASCPNASFRNGGRARQDATYACNLTHWKYWVAIDTLAAAYAETGDFESALRFQEKAIALAEAKRIRPQKMQELQDHLSSYKEHRPIRESLETAKRRNG